MGGRTVCHMPGWQVAGMKYVANCSFGKDSLSMTLRILEEVVFYDTGMEFDSIYHNRDRMRKLLMEKKIPFTELCPDHSFLFDMLVRPVRYRKKGDRPYPYHYGYEWCGGCARWGTAGKVSVINRYYREMYPGETIVEYIGIAFDEQKRIYSYPDGRTVRNYPLIGWKMTEADCLNYCHEKGFDWKENGIDLYDILDRVSCWCCRNKNLKELKMIYRYLPEYWQRLRGIQSRIPEPMKGTGKSVFELEERFEREIRAEKPVQMKEVRKNGTENSSSQSKGRSFEKYGGVVSGSRTGRPGKERASG